MMSHLKRKIGQLASDPVLRAWLIGRMTGKYASPDSFTPHHPPYLQGYLPLEFESATWGFPLNEINSQTPNDQLLLTIHGIDHIICSIKPERFFNASAGDIEHELARHRFAWLPLNPDIDPTWLSLLWRTWRERYMDGEGWPWHPYTAAERAVNLLDAAQRYGALDTPETFADDLAFHATAISKQLEYFGEHNTSNHLANNGRGLYRIGLALNMQKSREIGFEILSHEADRILLHGGALREGSTHYHLLYLRNYLDVWLAALRHDQQSDAAYFADITKRMISSAKNLVLPGGMPLIGDISPDCPPQYLKGISSGNGEWVRTLSVDEQQRVKIHCDTTPQASPTQAAHDGWVRADIGRWSLLAPCPQSGWLFMPGHAHQDIGSAEIHLDGQPLFIDPGRGGYGEEGEAALYRSSSVHGMIRVDNENPYPANKPYYSDAFRQSIAGPASVDYNNDGVTIQHSGYQRLGVTSTSRTWQFDDTSMHITDAIQGLGTHHIERGLITPFDVKIENDKAIIDGRIMIHALGAQPEVNPITLWQAYGEGVPGTQICFRETATAPWQSRIDIQVSA